MLGKNQNLVTLASGAWPTYWVGILGNDASQFKSSMKDKFLILIFGICFGFLTFNCKAETDKLPEKIEVITPWIAGDASLIAAKFIPILSRHLGGVPVEIKFVRGEFGQNALDYITKAKPDGSTILFGTTVDLMYRLLAYPEAVRRWDKLSIIDLLTFQSLGCAMSANSQFKDYPSFIAAIKSKEKKIRITTYTKLGTLFPAVVLNKLGLSVENLPFDLIHGDLTIDDMMKAKPNYVTCQTVASLRRMQASIPIIPIFSNHIVPIPEMPGMKSARQIGVNTLEQFLYWCAVLAPPKMSPPLLNRFRKALVDVHNDPEWKKFLNETYATSAVGKVHDLQKFFLEQELYFQKAAVLARWVE